MTASRGSCITDEEDGRTGIQGAGTSSYFSLKRRELLCLAIGTGLLGSVAVACLSGESSLVSAQRGELECGRLHFQCQSVC